jgi:hypothetical protein
MEFFERWGYGIVIGLAFLGVLAYVVATTRRDPETGMYRVDPMLFGFMASYIKRRGGLTRREVFGWGIVLLLGVVFGVVALTSGPR